MVEEKVKGRRPDITGVIGTEKVALWLSDDCIKNIIKSVVK